jgi:hypothetical protein
MTKRGQAQARLIAFDLLRLNGDDLRSGPNVITAAASRNTLKMRKREACSRVSSDVPYCCLYQGCSIAGAQFQADFADCFICFRELR